MNQLLNYEHLATQDHTDQYTAAEITNQPVTWKRIMKEVLKKYDVLSPFLNSIKHKSDLQIVLTGAGSSAFIGNIVADTWLRNFQKPVKAVPTTDLMTHFDQQIIPSEPLLLISFARSGNSPESKAVIDIADQKCSNVFHLIITCNPKGLLTEKKENKNTYVFLLPSEAEDQGLAMTNSFTSMALAATLIPRPLTEKDDSKTQVNILSEYGKKIISNFAELCFEIAQTSFNRIIFLGSGPLWGAAKESHLKVQELTNGDIIGKFDSFLGFRHGPKAVINEHTLLVYLLSNNKQTRRYENDLVKQIADHDINLTTLGVSEADDISEDIDYCIQMSDQSKLDEDFWAILSVLPAQIIGFYKSLLLGYNPDNPSTNGTISRVVEGVTIYEDEETIDEGPAAK